MTGPLGSLNVSITNTRKNTAVPEQSTPTVPAAVPKAVGTRRRRPALIGLSIALVAAGGLLSVMLESASEQRTQVLVVSQPLAFGQVITAQDLSVASISLDPALQPVDASALSSIVGKHAAAQLEPGSTLTRSDVTSAALVGPGQQLVGVQAKPGQLPATPLVPGEQVVIVTTPGQDNTGSTSAGVPTTLTAQVVRVGAADSSGDVTVDVAIDANDGPTLAARASTGNIAIVVQSPSAVG